MRTLGIPEKYITGHATDKEKFEKWAFTVPYTVRNPLYHWTHLELLRYFNISTLLTPDTADDVYKTTGALLKTEAYAVQGLIKKMNVEVICTTDDPVDSLEHHIRIRNNPFGTKVLPSFRPDKAYAVENPYTYNHYLNLLSQAADTEITSLTALLEALQKRINFFHDNGCRLSDHGLEYIPWPPASHSSKPEELFLKVRQNNQLNLTEANILKHAVLTELCRMYHAKGWT